MAKCVQNVDALGALIDFMLRMLQSGCIGLHRRVNKIEALLLSIADLIPLRIHFPGNIEDMRDISEKMERDAGKFVELNDDRIRVRASYPKQNSVSIL